MSIESLGLVLIRPRTSLQSLCRGGPFQPSQCAMRCFRTTEPRTRVRAGLQLPVRTRDFWDQRIVFQTDSPLLSACKGTVYARQQTARVRWWTAAGWVSASRTRCSLCKAGTSRTSRSPRAASGSSQGEVRHSDSSSFKVGARNLLYFILSQ